MHRMNLTQEQLFVSSFCNGKITKEEFLHQYERAIHFLISKRSIPPDFWDDCFQDCTIRLFECAHKYDYRPVKFMTYLLSDLREVTTKYLREDFYWQRDNASLDQMKENGFEPEGEKFDPELEVFKGKLREAINSLEQDEKNLIWFHFFEGREIVEAGKMVGIPKRFVYKRLQVILKKLRSILESASLSLID